METVTFNRYFGSDFYNMSISLFVLLVSMNYWENYGSNKVLLWLTIACIISAAVMGYAVYIGFIIDFDESLGGYAFDYKNSAAPIILNSALLGALFINSKNKIVVTVKWLSIAFLIFILFTLQSRATLLGFFFIIYFFLFRSKNRRLKRLTFIISIAAIAYILSNQTAYTAVVDRILLAGRDTYDLNELSSGRVEGYGPGWTIFMNNYMIGAGNMYFDCMPLVMLMQYGLIGATIVFAYIGRVYLDIRHLDRRNAIYLYTYLIFISLMLNSIFEAQSPFGPGAKCFIFWIMLGFTIAESKKDEKIRKTV